MIQGERIRLRSVEPNDLKLIWKWENDPQVAYYDGADAGRTISAEEIRERLEQARGSGTEKTYIVETEMGRPIGTISYYNLSIRHRNCWVAIKVGEKDYWGKGYGTDAMKALLHYLFDDLNLHRVQLWVVDYNERAIASYKKCGFQVEGTAREFYFVRGEWHNQIIMGVLAREAQRASTGARAVGRANGRVHLVA